MEGGYSPWMELAVAGGDTVLCWHRTQLLGKEEVTLSAQGSSKKKTKKQNSKARQTKMGRLAAGVL